MSEQRDPGGSHRVTVFEGGAQETVEIMPALGQLSPSQREEGVIARVGRDRIERRIQEGPTPIPRAQAPQVGRGETDQIQVATYRVAGYFAAVIATLILAVALGWVIVANYGY